MIMDRNGKIFGKINIIDLFVIIAILAAVIGFGARFLTIAAENVKEKVQFSYVVQVDGVRSYTVDALVKKGLVTDSKTKSIVGEIVNVEYKPFEESMLTASGERVTVEVPESYSVYVTVKSEGKESESGYFVGENIELSVGTTMSMTTKYVNTTGKVKSIEKID